MLSLLAAVGVALVTFVLYSNGAFDSPKKRSMRQSGHVLFMIQRAAKRGDWSTVSRWAHEQESVLRKFSELGGTEEELNRYLSNRQSLKEVLSPDFVEWVDGELHKRNLSP